MFVSPVICVLNHSFCGNANVLKFWMVQENKTYEFGEIPLPAKDLVPYKAKFYTYKIVI